MMMRKLTLILTLLLLAFGLANVFAHKVVRTDRQGILQRFESPKSQTNTDLMKILAGEFRGLAADYLLLEVGSFLGSDQKTSAQDWNNVYLTLKQALSLDPYFQQTYLYAQGQLPWQAEMPEKTTELLKISREHRPWDWFPGQYIGFNHYYFFDDYAKASEAFLRAAQIKGAPGLLAALGARFAIQGQRTIAAIGLLQDKLREENLNAYQKKYIEKRLMALTGIFTLEQALTAYRNQYGTYPLTLTDLVDARTLQAIPPNPYGKHFIYNPESGQVRFDRVKTKTKRLPGVPQ